MLNQGRGLGKGSIHKSMGSRLHLQAKKIIFIRFTHLCVKHLTVLRSIIFYTYNHNVQVGLYFSIKKCTMASATWF